MRTFRVADPIPTTLQAMYEHYDPLVAQLLYNRGIIERHAVDTFLTPDYETGRHDPFLLNDMDAAVTRILAAIRADEHIAIYSDYDCDGIPGAVVLHDFLRAIGHEHFSNHIPHRHFDGFGLSTAAVEKMADAGASLIVTIDCGTTDAAAVATARARGIDVIITDHHEPNGVTVDATAVVNPKVGGTYPFPDLCGAAVVFKMVEALIARGDFDLPPGKEKWWLDMVGIATIGDMVPLVGENRVFAHYGLAVLRKSRRPGLQQLLRKARADQRYLTEDDIGFTIAPRINAASRMDTPEDAFHMLAATDEADAGARVYHLERLNNERRGMVAAMSKELKKRITEMVTIPDVLVMGSPEWRPALAGLAANGLAETYQRPAFVWGRDGNGIIKGSCRSNGTTSVIALMNAAAACFLEHGGHHMSGGFSVRDEYIHSFPAELNTAFATLGEQAAIEEAMTVDAELSLDAVTHDLTDTLAKLGPYGTGNAKPLFAFNDVTPTSVETFGKSGDHTKLTFNTPHGTLEAIAFFAHPDSFTRAPEEGVAVRLIAHIERSHFMGRMQTRLRIVDIL